MMMPTTVHLQQPLLPPIGAGNVCKQLELTPVTIDCSRRSSHLLHGALEAGFLPQNAVEGEQHLRPVPDSRLQPDSAREPDRVL